MAQKKHKNLMTNLRNFLLLSVFVLTAVVLALTLSSEPPTEEATFFLTKMQEADRPVVLAQFGDNTCHCQPRGGFNAFLKFESGEADNLAFLWGQKFKWGNMNQRPIPTVEKFKGSNLPWEQPESTEVEVPLEFDPAVYSPYFLPLDMAFGYPMKEAEFDAFLKEPAKDFWNSLALRLRPSLDKGLVPPAPPPDHNRKPEFTADYYLTLGLPAEQTKYLKPTDAADLIMPDGKPKPAKDFAQKLPRLKRGILRLVVVRRGRFQRWAIKKGSFVDPAFVLADGTELPLKTPRSAINPNPGEEKEAVSNTQSDGSDTKSDDAVGAK